MITTEHLSENDNQNQEIIQWGCDYLLSHGYTLKTKRPENIVNTPWSSVVRFSTSEGYIYLKKTPALLALEAPITRILQARFHAFVPIIIAHNTEQHCFLMKDAGRSLREILKLKFDTDLFCKAIHQFTSLQLITADHIDIFFEIGVPDWRLDKLPDLYSELLLQKDILIEDGLTEIDIAQLRTLFSTVSSLCKKLSDYSIKQSIVQPDFSDNNTLIDSVLQSITTIDLGEIVISHPFFSLINCFQQIKKHYGLTEKDERYRQILDACFKNYRNILSDKQLLDAFEIARILSFIYGALANYRLMIACDRVKLMAFQRSGRLGDSLKEFMMLCQPAHSERLQGTN